MNDRTILAQLLREELLLPLEEEYGKKVARLTESRTSDCTALLRDLPQDALVVRIDKVPPPGKLFKGDRGECKRADFVIICCEERYIVYIEMKKNKMGGKDTVKQLQGALCLMEYCGTVGREFWKTQRFLKDYQQRFVVIGHVSMDKRPTRQKTTSHLHDSPENPLRIRSLRNLRFRSML